MGQVTIYLEDELERKMATAAKAAHLSKSKWIAGLIEARTCTEWPESVRELAGSWQDFPDIDELRWDLDKDIERDSL